MNYTDKLKLPILEDSDNFALTFNQPNEIANKLEEKFGAYDDLTTLVSDNTDKIATLKTDVDTSTKYMNDVKQILAPLNANYSELNNKVKNNYTELSDKIATKNDKIQYFVARHSSNVKTNIVGGNNPYRLLYDSTMNGSANFAYIENGYIKISKPGVYIVMTSCYVSTDSDGFFCYGPAYKDLGTFASVYTTIAKNGAQTFFSRPTIRLWEGGEELYTSIYLQPNKNGVVEASQSSDEFIIIRIGDVE